MGTLGEHVCVCLVVQIALAANNNIGPGWCQKYVVALFAVLEFEGLSCTFFSFLVILFVTFSSFLKKYP